jgi:hypothetical protein
VIDTQPCQHLQRNSLHQFRNATTWCAPSFPTVNMKLSLSGDLTNILFEPESACSVLAWPEVNEAGAFSHDRGRLFLFDCDNPSHYQM